MLRNNKGKTSITILVVTDNQIIRAALKMLLNSDPLIYVIAESSRAGCIDAAAANNPDVIVLLTENRKDLNLISLLTPHSNRWHILALICGCDRYLQLKTIRYGVKGIISVEDDPSM